MASNRRKALVSKRRLDEEEGDQSLDLEDDDSQSEISLSDDDVAEGSDTDEVEILTTQPSTSVSHSPEFFKAKHQNGGQTLPKISEAQSPAHANLDTEMMMNGLKVSDNAGDVEELHFDDANAPETHATDTSTEHGSVSKSQIDQPPQNPGERRRREHDEYKVKRDTDPAFVPNRGTFFMHDHRHNGPAANGFRPFGGRGGRGRGGFGHGPQKGHSLYGAQPEVADIWTHDMHETVAQAERRGSRQNAQPLLNSHAGSGKDGRGQVVERDMSLTRVVGKLQPRVFLPTVMTEAIKCSVMTCKQYTLLPDHRPPLRRDKPVRVFFSNLPVRYIRPTEERSFIFIPRSMRPNQHGLGYRRGRGLGSIDGHSARTSVVGTSIYGDSYTVSAAMSRRSSVALSMYDSRNEPFSPAVYSPYLDKQQQLSQLSSERPVVRLPPSMQLVQPLQNVPDGASGVVMESVTNPQMYFFPQSQKQAQHEIRSDEGQLKSTKNGSEVETQSPRDLQYHPSPQIQQAFYQQIPTRMNGNIYGREQHSRNASHISHESSGTPVSHIPERAIHAQPFQPSQYPQSFSSQTFIPNQLFYPGAYDQTNALQDATLQAGAQPQAALQESFVLPGQQDGSMPPALVAQEVNGMVYYYDAGQIPAVNSFPQQTQYPMQPLAMIAPRPDSFYYGQHQGQQGQQGQGLVYYS